MFYEIYNGKVFAIYAENPNFNAGVLVVESSTPGVAVGWTYDGVTLAAPSITAPTQAQLLAYAQSVQSRIASGGILVNVGTAGAPIMVEVDTDTDGKSNITGAVQGTSLSPTTLIPWFQNGGAISLNQAQVQSMALAAFHFEQSTWSALATAAAEIAAGTLTTQAEIDAFAWPVNS